MTVMCRNPPVIATLPRLILRKLLMFCTAPLLHCDRPSQALRIRDIPSGPNLHSSRTLPRGY